MNAIRDAICLVNLSEILVIVATIVVGLIVAGVSIVACFIGGFSEWKKWK